MCWNLGPKPSNLPGFNTYSASSELGTRVVVLQRGAAFGETGQPKDDGKVETAKTATDSFTNMVMQLEVFHHVNRCIYKTLEMMG